jgi:ABC-type multidrug transport system ATPase subunit/pSer/pThr/pTyr-binding forkhead associated (FHA) protein
VSNGGSEVVTADLPSVTLVRPARQSIRVLTDAASVCSLGSAAGQDVVLTDRGVCEKHARLYWDQGRLMLEALSAAPVTVNGAPLKGATPVMAGDWVTLGHATLQIAIAGNVTPMPALQSPDRPTSATPASTTVRGRSGSPQEATKSLAMRQDQNQITIGRLPENDACIPSPIVSRHHARILREGGRYFIEDLASTNGTFVNGQRVLGRIPLGSGDRLQFGSFAYLFNDGRLRETEGTGFVRVEARGVEKVVQDAATGKPKRLLAGINLAIAPGEFVAIVGPGGCGKSSFLDALNGRRPASAGSVLYNGMDLHRSFDLFKSTIGYVPQQDIVHRRISIHNALGYTARLRLPEDTSDSEIDEQIARVLGRVGLAEKLWQPIDTPAPLSGGQLKRVSVAIELVANPSILFLDEATSGQDAGTDKKMMRLFGDLASDGKTVVCVTHTLENIDLCDLMIVLCAGYLVYFGPPGGMNDHFRITRPSEVYGQLETGTPESWAATYENSAFHRQYVAERLASAAPHTAAPSVNGTVERKPAPWFDLRQTGILTRRYIDLMLADRKTLIVLLTMAPGIAFIFASVFPTGGYLVERAETENKLIILMIMTMVFCGCFNSCREVVKELQIYLRERTVNLGIGSYIVSKVLPLAVICGIQCLSLLLIMAVFAPVPGDVGARLLPLFLTGIAATMMGLTISAMVAKPDMALPIALLISFPQIALANALVKLPSAAEAVAKVSVIAFWGYDCLKTTLAPEVRSLVGRDGQPALSIAGSYWADNAALLAFSAVFFATAVLGLKRKDRER